MKRTLVVVSSHYEIDLERVSEGYVLPEGDDLTEAEVRRLVDVAEGRVRRWSYTSMRRWFRLCLRSAMGLILQPHPPATSKLPQPWRAMLTLRADLVIGDPWGGIPLQFNFE